MPLPLPIMIPFMMWQSAAIAAGFGTYFQFAKRRVSAMSNEDFNKSDPHELVNSMYEDIVKSIPSSFAKVDSLTPVILQSMNVMLDQAVKWFQGVITGNIGGTPNPFNVSNIGGPTPELGDFVPGERGQAAIPSTAWLNSLSREQLKALRNDALRGDYTDDSKKLILARYKEVFEFDRTASLPDPGLPGIPINTINIKNFQFSISKYPDIPKTTIFSLNVKLRNGDTKRVVRSLAALRSNAIQQSKTQRSSTARNHFARLANGYTKMILELNQILGA